MEKLLDFEKKICKVHKENRVNEKAYEYLKGVRIIPCYKIICSKNANKVLLNAASDLKDYFKTSMKLNLELVLAMKAKKILYF